MSERRRVTWTLQWAAIAIAVGAAFYSAPAFGQHPNHPPPPPPRPPAHAPPRQVTRQQPPVQKPTPKVDTRVHGGGAPGAGPGGQAVVPGGAPSGGEPIGSRVNTIPHPPARPWEKANIPESERPPPGMCRVWLNNVPASSQPAPTSCAKAIQTRPSNGQLIFGEDGRRPSATRVPPANSESAPAPAPPNESPFIDR